MDAELRVKEQITFIYCADLERTSAFYEDILGFELVVDQGFCRIVRAAENGGFLGYCAGRAGTTTADGIILTLVTEGVDGWHRYLQGRGVQVENAPEWNDEFAIYHFFFRDPDGYRIEIQRFGDRNWCRKIVP